MTGWMTPEALIDVTSSSNASGLKDFLGWTGFGSIWSIGISINTSSAAGAAERRAPRPRPSPRLFMAENLPRQFQICNRSARSQIMQHHWLAVARSLREPHVARNHRVEDLAREVAVHLVPDLERQARPSIEHRENDAPDRETWIQPLANELDGLEQMGEPLERVELALQRHQHTIGRREGVDRQEPEGRGAVDDHEVVRLGHGLEGDAQAILALADGYELDLGADQVDVGREQLQMHQRGLANGLLGGLVPKDHVIDGRVEPGLLKTQPCRGIALRVQVHKEGRALREGEAGCKIDGGGRLSHAALLVGDRKDSSYWRVPRATSPITPSSDVPTRSVPRATLSRQAAIG